MRYIKDILKKNSIWVLVYIGLGIFNSFVANYKVDYFQKVIDGLADRTLAFAGVATYGFILLVNYCMNYLDNYPKKKLEHGIYLDFKVLSLRKISTIDYTEYQKIGTGKLVQRIENGSAAEEMYVGGLTIGAEKPEVPPLIYARVTSEGVERF